MLTALDSDLNLRALLIRATEIGAAFSPHALPDPALASIGAEIETCSFNRLPEQPGPYGVREDAELLRIPPDDTMRYPTVVRLRANLTHLVHQQGGGLAGLDTWEPNDIAAMRYRAGSFGITPHRDSQRYQRLIAIFTTEGSAPFTFCANREGDIIDKWTAAPGSLILMRGTGLNGAENRPFHAVAGPTTRTRVSLTFRMSDRYFASGRGDPSVVARYARRGVDQTRMKPMTLSGQRQDNTCFSPTTRGPGRAFRCAASKPSLPCRSTP